MFWDTDAWHAYEIAYGDEPGTRSRLLAAADWRTRVVDLSLSEADLWRGVRKSYRSLIRRAEREQTIHVWDEHAERPGLWVREFQLSHRLVSGRSTRPMATWQIMAEWLRDGHGLMVGMGPREELEWSAFAYAVRHGAWAYYFSGVVQQDNLSHAAIWTMMLALKVRGVRWFELGWQGEAQDEKGKHIEFFKRGFGGVDMPAREAPCLASCA